MIEYRDPRAEVGVEHLPALWSKVTGPAEVTLTLIVSICLWGGTSRDSGSYHYLTDLKQIYDHVVIWILADTPVIRVPLESSCCRKLRI